VGSKGRFRSAAILAAVSVFLVIYVLTERRLIIRILAVLFLVLTVAELVRTTRSLRRNRRHAPEPTSESAGPSGRSCPDQVDVRMPSLGEGMESACVLRWKKNIGEQIERGEPLVEISTDKVDTEVVSPATGVLTRVLTPTGRSVAVGTTMGTICPHFGDEPPAY
jgi:biotin carboxyl carrier protein